MSVEPDSQSSISSPNAGAAEEMSIEFDEEQFFNFQKDEVLFEAGDEARGVYCVYAGRVKLIRKDKFENEHIIRLTKPGDLLGLNLFIDDKYEYSAVALDSVRVCYIPKEDFVRLFKSNFKFALSLMKTVCYEIREVEKRITVLFQGKSRQRVAEVLLYLRGKYGLDDEGFIRLVLPLKDIANFADTSSATLSRILSEFKRNHLIVIRGHRIRLMDEEKLKQIARL